MNAVPVDEVIPGPRLRAAVVVAHPDDETLWCGGYILAHPEFDWRIVTLCRASDPDRAPKFRRVLEQLGAVGEMADLDDEPDQVPLPIEQILETTARLLAGSSYSLILTHGPKGVGMRSAAEAWLSFGNRAASTQSGYGSLLTKMVVARTCLGSARMRIGGTF
jgi:hypothetical protein